MEKVKERGIAPGNGLIFNGNNGGLIVMMWCGKTEKTEMLSAGKPQLAAAPLFLLPLHHLTEVFSSSTQLQSLPASDSPSFDLYISSLLSLFLLWFVLFFFFHSFVILSLLMSVIHASVSILSSCHHSTHLSIVPSFFLYSLSPWTFLFQVVLLFK